MINISIFKPSSHIVFGGIQRYCNTLTQPYGNARIKFWIPSNTLNTVKYWVLRIELVSIQNTVKYPRRPSATVGNHMGMHQVPLDTFGTHIIFFLNIFSNGHGAATNDGDHRPFVREHPFCLFKQIPSKYKYTGNYCWQPNYGIWIANIKFRILSNTAKYYMGTSLYQTIRELFLRKAWSRMSHTESNCINTFYMPQMPRAGIYISTYHKYKCITIDLIPSH